MLATVMLLAAALGASADECREAYAAVHYRQAADACLAVVAEVPLDQLQIGRAHV